MIDLYNEIDWSDIQKNEPKLIEYIKKVSNEA